MNFDIYFYHKKNQAKCTTDKIKKITFLMTIGKITKINNMTDGHGTIYRVKHELMPYNGRSA